MQSFALFLCLYSALTPGGAQIQPKTHIIPEGTESVNGSDVDGGCQTALSPQRLCGSTNSGTISYLIDGNILVLNTAAPNWASQLVTVRKNSPTVAIPYDHVLLVFNYISPVSLISVELNLFYCHEWNIGAPNITVYVDEDDAYFITYVEGAAGIAVRGNVVLSFQSSCDSLLPVRIPLENTTTHHKTWYIVVSFDPQPEIEWVHVGEVTLFDTEPLPPVSAKNPSTTSSIGTPITDMTTSLGPTPPPSTADNLTPTTTSSADNVTPTTVSSSSTTSSMDTPITGMTTSLVPASPPSTADNVNLTPTTTSPADSVTPTTTMSSSNPTSVGSNCSPALIAVSAVSLLLSAVVVVQCLVIERMRKSLLITTDTSHNQVYAEIETHGTIPASENEAYGLHKRTTAQQEAVYENVQETRAE